MAYASYDDYVTRFLGRAIRDEAEFDRLAPLIRQPLRSRGRVVYKKRLLRQVAVCGV